MTHRFFRIPMFLAIVLGAAAFSPAQNMPMYIDPDAKPLDPAIKVPDFEVSSIKPNKSGNKMMRVIFKPDGFSGTNLNLKMLIGNAYQIRQDLISGGPSWVGSTGFDIEAKVAGADVEALKKVPRAQQMSMLRNLLADRFKLVVHTETKVLPTYDLVPAKGGTKIVAAPAGEVPENVFEHPEAKRHPGMMSMGPNFFEGTGLPLSSLTGSLSSLLHHTVIDKTGLTGKYDFKLKFTPDDAPGAAGSDNPDPTLFTALQEQLGLKLVPSKGPTETIVIDHVELPTEN
jgi:uncharacterized protein (TIGR03435 family)